MFNKKINDITIHQHYNPTGLEQIQNMIQAYKTKERLQKELVKPVSKARIENAYREFLEVTERYDLSKRSELNYK
ncbi:MAG: hypothetical protein EOM67_17010 [Spirochaetia bacterium]|nr:hypothetical protein [Spirochaetia bacterium]